ncbi:MULTISPECIES: carbohydrate ABC transporter permease [Enterococcus]|jgi:putative aldouronate transport system permease protein|uniref:carbohydrate ABC transporter permease n=1 Tax=Enterococcus TaxID=1350 RepID=UPI000A342BCC|nr:MULTISPECIES: carbohydrate ABC transporter permease [unclassified Enterococcus]AUJ84216.1 carbohydrate ABC transporter permease [Enterococcus sp. CR-Ec1]MBO1120590.1 carbohydrate ABC transporter permease [Enterococcus casseliflavus]OTO26520.1 sugar ABC transporter permease [Enterococcus sp. 3C7_DIV0644]OTO30945.1 sugar ABC transporter permease [Enterococcus sp. 3C8_DIV0646]
MKKSKKTGSERIFDFFVYGVAILLILLIIYPLWFVIIASFSDPADVGNGNVWLWPNEWRLDGYIRLFEQTLFWRGYLNTILYTIVGTAVALFVNIPAGYALSRKDLHGRKWLALLFIIPMFVSGGLIPIYLTIKNVGLLDTFWVMVIPFAVSSYNIIVARTFFNNSIPAGLWEAAQIDGCGTIRYFFSMVLPLSKAILAVIGLWTAVGIWNSWFNALIYLTNDNLQPLQLILRRLLISNQLLQTQATGELASELRATADMMKYAAIVVSTAPIMMLYPFLQKYFNQGVMIGALKE